MPFSEQTNTTSARAQQTVRTVLVVFVLCLVCAAVAWYIGRTQGSNNTMPSAVGSVSVGAQQNSEAAVVASTTASTTATVHISPPNLPPLHPYNPLKK